MLAPAPVREETKANTRSSSTPSVILVSRMRDMEAPQTPTALSDIVARRYHLVLGNIGDDVVVFGARSSLELLAATPVVQCDGSFPCCLPDCDQLSIFHGLVNNVTGPLVYALVKGKGLATYSKLFELVETIAETNGVILFNRPVDIIVEFEKASINELTRLVGETHSTGVTSTSPRAFPQLGEAEGRVPPREERGRGRRRRRGVPACRSIMAIPHLPLEPVAVETVLDIRKAFKFADKRVVRHVDVFVNDYFVENYVEDGCMYPPRLWSVCGKHIRTNNSAASSHNFLNKRVQGALTPWLFISIIQQMDTTRNDIEARSASRTKAINTAINALLNTELLGLLAGETPLLKYLERCAQIVQLKNKGERAVFERTRRAEKNTVSARARKTMAGLRGEWPRS